MLYPRTCCCGADEKPAGYFFAHMMKSDYGRLYYSVSTDGLHWTLLNNGKRVSKDYRGHIDICRGHDGRFNITGGSKTVSLWVSGTAAPRPGDRPAPDIISISRIMTSLRISVMVV